MQVGHMLSLPTDAINLACETGLGTCQVPGPKLQGLTRELGRLTYINTEDQLCYVKHFKCAVDQMLCLAY